MRFNSFFAEYGRTTLNKFLKTNPVRNKEERFSKNDVLSVSGELGVVNQIEHLGRSYAGESVALYHILRKGQIVYTKSPLAESPYGIIKLNRFEDGIVSTLYAVYDVLNKADCRYIEHYFAYKPRLNNYLRPIVRIGAKHDMKIGNDEVLKNYVNFPSKEEQKKISDFLDLIDQRIETQNKIIDKCKSLIKCICDNAEMSANRQLKDIAYYNSSNVKESVVNNNGKYPVFGAAGICGYLDDYVFSKAGIAIVKDGAGVGRLLKIKNDKYSILGTMGLIETKNGISQDYLWLSLKKIKFEKYIVGSGIPHIYFSDYSSAQIPSFTDRNFIRAKLCDLLLEKIKIDEDILAKFLKQKEFLLNNLFI